jgi:branched-chain amino acid transport system permease protein
VIEGVTALGSPDTFAASLAIVLGVGGLLAVHALRRSPSGLALRASADAPEAAAALDLPLRRARWVTWMVTATVAGAAGAVATFPDGAVSSGDAFSLSAWALPALVAIGVGGMESVEGPLLGALLWAAGTEVTEGHELAFQLGAAAVALLVQGTFGPGGIWGRIVGSTGTELFPARRLFSPRHFRRGRAGGRGPTPGTGPSR